MPEDMDNIESMEELDMAIAQAEADDANAKLGLTTQQAVKTKPKLDEAVAPANFVATTRKIHSDDPRSGGTKYQGVIMLGRVEVLRTRDEFTDPHTAVQFAKENFATRLYNALAKLN